MVNGTQIYLRLKYCAIAVMCVWIIPLITALVFPFELPIKQKYIVTSVALISIVTIVVIPLIFGRRAITACVHLHTTDHKLSGKIIYFSPSLWLSYIAPFFLYLDLYQIRGLDLFTSDFGANRYIYNMTVPSVFGYASYLLSGFGILQLGRIFLFRSLIRKLSLLTPYLLVSSLYVISGNRQYLFFGLLFLFYSYLLAKPINIKRMILNIVYVGMALTLFFALMLVFQIKRQSEISGDQVDFLYAISDMECIGNEVCYSPVILPMAYFYQYYGNEYQDCRSVRQKQRMSSQWIFFYSE